MDIRGMNAAQNTHLRGHDHDRLRRNGGEQG
jgi:hypothetical protein